MLTPQPPSGTVPQRLRHFVHKVSLRNLHLPPLFRTSSSSSASEDHHHQQNAALRKDRLRSQELQRSSDDHLGGGSCYQHHEDPLPPVLSSTFSIDSYRPSRSSRKLRFRQSLAGFWSASPSNVFHTHQNERYADTVATTAPPPPADDLVLSSSSMDYTAGGRRYFSHASAARRRPFQHRRGDSTSSSSDNSLGGPHESHNTFTNRWQPTDDSQHASQPPVPAMKRLPHDRYSDQQALLDEVTSRLRKAFPEAPYI